MWVASNGIVVAFGVEVEVEVEPFY